MTQLININLQRKTTKHHSVNSIPYSTKSSIAYFDSQQSQFKGQNQDHWSFIYETEQIQFKLYFSIFTQNSSITINIYLLNQDYQIYKIKTISQRNIFMKSFLKHKTLYQPNIDPSTGFVYFKVSYYDYKLWKGGGKKQIKYHTKDILKIFNLQILIDSARKLSEFGLIMGDEYLTNFTCNNQNSYLQLSKIVSKLTYKNQSQQLLSQKNNQEKTERQNKAKTQLFVKQIAHFTSAIPPRQYSISPIRIKNFLASLTYDYNQLLTLVKRKTGRSNYDSLLVNQSTTKKLNQLMTSLLYKRQSFSKQIFKTLEAELGKITLQIECQDQKKFQSKISFLQSLPKHTEYHFLDKYFRSGINIPVILRLSLKDESLAKFLETNKKTMSLETKMRLMLQLYSSVTTLWQQNKILLYVNKLQNIFITKNLTVKLRGLQSWQRPQHHVLLEQKNEVNKKIIENLMNLTKLYFKIFHQHTLIFVRPAYFPLNIQLDFLKFCRQRRPLQYLMHSSIMQQGLISNGLKHFFAGLNFVFCEQFELAKKIMQNQKTKSLQLQRFIVNNGDDDFIESEVKKQKQSSQNISQKLLNLKHTCSWLFKILQAITKEIQ